MKKLLAVVTALTMTAALLAGCGSAAGSSSSSSESEAASQASVETEAAETAAAEDTAAAESTAAESEAAGTEAADAASGSGEVYNIGICQLLQHDALDQATQGFKDAMVELLGEDRVVFDEQNASNDSATCATIINQFVSPK